MMAAPAKNARTFYELQEERQWKTYALLLPVWLLYFIGFFIVYACSIGIVFSSSEFSMIRLVPQFFGTKAFAALLATSLLVALAHWLDAYFRGGQYILEVLGAKELDPEDSYHQRLRNVLEEMKLASGLKNVRGMVLPTVAMNAFALQEGREKCVIGVTEGLLGRLTRSQLEAAIAHEFSHIAKRDIFYITMVCSLRNVFTKMIEILEKAGEDARKDLIIFVMRMVEALMRVSSAFISRQREYLADATAVEYTRDPLALAEALCIIGRSNRWVGGVSGLYAPLFIVSTSLTTRSEGEGFLASVFSTHPPTQERMDTLLAMAHVGMIQMQEEIAKREEQKESARKAAAEEQEKYERFFVGTEKPRWLVRREGDKWEGPFFVGDLLEKPWFMFDTWVSRIGSSAMVQASADPDIVMAFQRKYGRGEVFGAMKACPKCKVSLERIDYEGAPVLACRSCGGMFVGEDKVRRVLARRDRGFSERLSQKAKELWERFYYVPSRVKLEAARMDGDARLCPRCGVPMLRRGYSYQYFVLVDYCSLCRSYWFDKDELEILQFLMEEQCKEE